MRKIPLGIAVALVLGSPNVFAEGQVYGTASELGTRGSSQEASYNKIQSAVNNHSTIINQVSKKTTQLETNQQALTSTVNEHDIKLQNQQKEINAAVSDAASAKKDAEAAKADVKGATEAAKDAAVRANSAQSTAEAAKDAAKDADDKAKAAQATANQADTRSQQNANNITSLGDRVTDNSGKIAALQGSIGKGAVAYEMAVENKDAIKQETRDRIEGDKQTLAASKAYTDSKYGQLSEAIEKNRKESFAGIAAALAASQVPQVTQGSYFSLGAGAGSYQGQTAVAVGMSARFSDNLVSKLTVTADTQQRTGLGAGFAVEW